MSLEKKLGGLSAMSAAELRSEWRRVYKSAPPTAFTPDLLMRGIAYRLQEKALGGLSLTDRHELRELAAAAGKTDRGAGTARTRLRPGNTIVRRWRGTAFAVQVTEEGFVFEGRRYSSLSVIAREITGTRWSGPRFFGCKGKGDETGPLRHLYP